MLVLVIEQTSANCTRLVHTASLDLLRLQLLVTASRSLMAQHRPPARTLWLRVRPRHRRRRPASRRAHSFSLSATTASSISATSVCTSFSHL